MPSLPKIKMKESPIVKRNHNVALGILVSMIVMIALMYKSLPDLIPVYFNLSGEVDAMGKKGNIWILVFIGSALFVLLRIAGRYPHTHNYQVIITEETASFYYSKNMELLSYTNVLTMVLLSILSFIIFFSTKYTSFPFGTLFILITVLYLVAVISKAQQINKATKIN